MIEELGNEFLKILAKNQDAVSNLYASLKTMESFGGVMFLFLATPQMVSAILEDD